MIEISLRKEAGLHKNYKVKVGGMLKYSIFDFYHFFISLPEDDKPKFYKLFVELLRKYIDLIESMNPGDHIYLPIGLHDQSSAFIYVKLFNERGVCNMYLANGLVEGFSINPWKSVSYNLSYDQVFSILGGVDCNRKDIVEGLSKSIDLIAASFT